MKTEQMPSSFELESEFLGQLMMLGLEDRKIQLEKILSDCPQELFYWYDTRKIFTLMKKNYLDYNKLPTIINLTSNQSNEFSDLIMSVSNSAVTTATMENNLEQLNDLYGRRLAIYQNELFGNNLHQENNIENLINEKIRELKEISAIAKPAKQAITKDTIIETIDMIGDCVSGKSSYVVPYCISAIDYLMAHCKKQMHVLAAFSGIGKTAFALSCINQQIANNIKVALFCGESSRHELMTKLICLQTRKSWIWYMQGMPGATSEDKYNFQMATERLNAFSENLLLYGKGDYVHSVSGIDKIMQKTSGIKMIWIDYLQNMQHGKNLNVWESVAENVMEINRMIGEYDVAGTLLCQVNREASKAERPHMHHLKYSSTIENEAHIITFLNRNEQEQAENKSVYETEWYSDKDRGLGRRIATRLAFVKSCGLYAGIYTNE